MASYRKKSSGKWEITVSLGRDSEGKKKRHIKGGFDRKKDAEEYYKRCVETGKFNVDIISTKVPLKDFIVTWFNEIKARTLGISTKSSYRNRIHNHIIPNLGDKLITDITPMHVQEFYNSLINSGLKPVSVKKVIEVLNGCFKHAKKMKLITDIPMDIEKVSLKIGKKHIVAWNEVQLKYFLEEIKDHYLYAPVLITALTGMRIGELCGLRWRNVDLEKGIISIREQTLNDKDNKILVHTKLLKTDSSNRNITIPKILINLLNDLKDSNSNFVILDRSGNMCNPRNLSMNFTKIVNKYRDTLDDKIKNSKKEVNNYVQLPQISIHGLRHTHATILLLKGENIKIIADRLGHTSTKITLDTYAHVLDEMRINTTSYLDDIFT